MPKFNMGFSEKLISAAQFVANDDLDSVDAKRTVLYLSSLASEITLKALLEKAGKSIKEIRSRGHCLSNLLDDLGKCEIQAQVTAGSLRWVPASRLRFVTVDKSFSDAMVGKLLTGEERGASKYPNEVRYGEHVKGYNPEHMLAAARVVLDWAREHWNEIRLKIPNTPSPKRSQNLKKTKTAANP